MLVRYLFLFPAVLSIMIQRELGSIYLTEGESYELYLSDYFSGNNLSFAISDSNMTAGSAILENKCEFEILAFLPFQNSSWNETWAHSSLKPLISWRPIPESYEIIIWYNLKYIVFYNFSSERGEIEMFWNGFIDTGENIEYSQIEDIKIYSSNYGQISYALIWAKQQENTLIWRNNFYYMNLLNLSALENPKWVNFSEATYASNIILAHGEISNIISIYLEFSSSPSAIYLYNITNIEEPILNQVISKYYGVLISKLSVASMYINSIYLYILDTNFGLINYIMSGSRDIFFKENEWAYYGYVGTLSSMWEYSFDFLGVISSSGVLFFKNPLQRSFIGFLEGKGMNWENGCLQITENYYFVQSSNGILSVGLSWVEPLQILYKIDISHLVGESFQATGQWGFLINDGIFYLRFDMDGLRIYKAYLEEWSLKIWGNSTYYVQITAKSQNDDIISSTLYVNSIPQNSQEIFQIDMYRPVSISPIELIADGQNGTYFYIALNDYFSGPNLEFTIVDLPDLNTASFEIIAMNKLKLYQNVSLSSNITNFLISGANIVYFYDNKVMADTSYGPITINVTNPIKFLWSRGYVIYSKPSQNSFLIISYFYSSGITQTFPSEIDCIFFLCDYSYLICANSHQIDVYYNNETSEYVYIASLTGEQFEKGSSWNITDLEISSSIYSMLYIYIIDSDLGAAIVDLFSIIKTTEPYNYYGKVSGAKNVINTGSEICFVFENFIEIYGYSLEYWKTILTNIYEPIVGTYGESNMIYLITSSALYIFNSDQPSHNSLFYTLPISNPSLLSFGLFDWGDMRIANFNPDKHYAEIYISSCPNKESNVGCSLYYTFYMHIGNSKYLKDFSLQTSISIAAFNKENLLKETFPINLVINGNFPWYQEENWENHKNIPYNERYELDLSKFFEGQNILMTLSVNGNYSFNETVENWPAVIPQRTELLGKYDLNKHNGISSHIIIPNTEIAVILSFSEFFIIDATGLTNKAVALNLTEISNINDLKCYFMDVFPHTQNNLTLLITSCIYRIPEAIEYKNTTTYTSEFAYAIILWELDYINFEIIKCRLFNTYSDHNYLKVAPLDAHSFEILAFYTYGSTLNYINNIYRYSGRWKINDISISQCEVINYFSLGLNSFYAILAEFIVKDSETVYWYIIDNQYGIRIIQTTKTSTSILVGGLYIELNYYFLNFGLWGDTLYIYSEGWMKSFKLRSYTRLEEDLNYGAYELPESDYLFVLNNIVSSKDNRYIACPAWRSDLGLLIRIWDTKAKNSSNIISEIYASEINTLLYPVSMQFIGNSILTFYISHRNEYRSYKINENYLIFPKMSKEEYSEMTNLWGTNSFYLYVIAENANGEVASKYLYFNREVRGKKSDNYWWIWVLVSIAIVACIIGGGLYIRKLLKAHRRRSLELILMREIHNKEGLQDTELN